MSLLGRFTYRRLDDRALTALYWRDSKELNALSERQGQTFDGLDQSPLAESFLSRESIVPLTGRRLKLERDIAEVRAEAERRGVDLEAARESFEVEVVQALANRPELESLEEMPEPLPFIERPSRGIELD